MKSHFVPYDVDPVQGAIDAKTRRRQQAEMVSTIIGRQERPDSKFVLTGDMNDPPDSPDLAPMLTVDGPRLVNALENPAETRPAIAETLGQGPGPASPPGPTATTRPNPPGAEFPRCELFDQIWLSQPLATRYSNPTIDRRSKHGGEGSDHDPAWVDLDL